VPTVLGEVALTVASDVTNPLLGDLGAAATYGPQKGADPRRVRSLDASLGVDDVVVLEREQHAGGVPRHCGHLGFGWREFARLLTGPGYAKRLVGSARTVAITAICWSSGAPEVSRTASSSGATEARCGALVTVSGSL